MADKLFDSSDFYSKRFVCECLDAGHSLDVSVEVREGKNMPVLIEFWARYYGHWMSFPQRLRAAVRILRKKDVSDHDFVLREEDVSELIELLKKVVEK